MKVKYYRDKLHLNIAAYQCRKCKNNFPMNFMSIINGKWTCNKCLGLDSKMLQKLIK